jgi:hypothetical protein
MYGAIAAVSGLGDSVVQPAVGTISPEHPTLRCGEPSSPNG